MQTAADLGVASYSFWAWDTASGEQWAAIGNSRLLQLRPLFNGPDLGERVSALQRVLKGLGQPIAVDGNFGAHTQAALAELQRQLGIPSSGQLDRATLLALKQPR
jgi:peptidoglycan hydrolase-like protein with peptidoglycan-binding domain